MDQGEFRSADSIFQFVLDSRCELLGENNPDYIATLNSLGNLYSEIGDYKQAVYYLKKSIQLGENTFGENSSDFAALLNNVGVLYLDMSDYKLSETYFKKALDINMKKFGDFFGHSNKLVDRILKENNIGSWKEFANQHLNYNHKITDIKVLYLDTPVPVFDMEIENTDNTHNFLVEQGVVLHNSKATLAQTDIRFSRTISSIQKIIISEMNKLAMIHLYAKGFDGEDLINFELKLSNPSTVATQQKFELWDTKMDVAGTAKDFLVGMDSMGDASSFEMDKLQGDNKMFILMNFRIGGLVLNPTNKVLYITGV
jgi:tetratricopeptide (TPR) repeat protein